MQPGRATADQIDSTLLSDWRAGDRASGLRLFRRHYPPIFRFFQSKLATEAEDLTHETFLACLEQGGQLREGASVRAYLFGIARHLLVDRFRRHHRRDARTDPLVDSIAELVGSPGAVLDSNDSRRLLLLALRRLPIDLQIMVELYYWEEFSVRETAEVVGVPEGTVKSRLSRARRLLSEHIESMRDVPEALRSQTIQDMEQWAVRLRDMLSEGGQGPPNTGA